MRAGEVLETVPGVVISQHSGEGKANQYYLRGFNLDHGTDFATTRRRHAGEHADARARPRLLGPQLPDSRAGQRRAVLEGPVLRRAGRLRDRRRGQHQLRERARRGRSCSVGGGGQGFGRALAAASPAVGARPPARRRSRCSTTTARGMRPDDYRKVNGVVRYSQGDARERLRRSPAWAIAATWNSTDQVPARAIDDGLIGRFGTLDHDRRRRHRTATAARSSGSGRAATPRTKVTAYGIGYDLNLFSNFTYFLDDPEHGDQFQQADHRFVSGAQGQPSPARPLGRPRRCRTRSACSCATTTSPTSACITPQARAAARDHPRRTRCCRPASAATRRTRPQWTPWLRTLAGLRVDGYRFDVDAGDPANSGPTHAGLVSPKGGVVLGPLARHRVLRQRRPRLPQQRRARRDDHASIRRPASRRERVTPLVARDGRRGRRPHACAMPHLQTSARAVDAAASTPS